MASRPTATPGAKMMYLIRRCATTSRNELVAHWFANHMPLVIAGQHRQAEAGERHATRYEATLFETFETEDEPTGDSWDGVAQLWWERPLPQPDRAHGTEPADSFQERVEPYVPWASTEYVVLDGTDRLPVEPLTLNDPFPTTRSGFTKLTSLVAAQDGADAGAFFDHWLDVHAPNVMAVMARVGGFRYVVSQSLSPETEPYAGMAELYFPDPDTLRAFGEEIEPDGMARWVDARRTLRYVSDTEMIGIP